MDNQQPELTKDQLDALKEEVQRGAAFEEMMTTKGWAYINAYYQNQIKSFMSEVMNSTSSIVEFENKRQQLLGLKKLLSQIDSAVQTLIVQREKDKNEPA